MFYGWRVVGAAFVLAVFGWGIGFYGPPVFLHAVRQSTGWPVSLISAAVTAHFLIGAAVVANLPALHGSFGLANVTRCGAFALALGVAGWAIAAEPWQLFAATVLSGCGWGTMSAGAVNAIVSPWFARARPAALGAAYNGGSIGGVIFSPLWVVAISAMGFSLAAGVIGAVTILVVWALASRYFARTPRELGLGPDGDPISATPAEPPPTSARAQCLPGRLLWRDARFLTLAAGMALGLFAQVGLITHLFSLLVPALGTQGAGLAMGGATAAAILGRTVVGWLMPPGADRRLVASMSYAVQIAGSLAFVVAAGTNVPLLLIGVVLFGVGIGNATSLPPLIAQVEFSSPDVPRAVALVVAVSQATFAFAPAAFGLIRELAPAAGLHVFVGAALIQALAIGTFVAGRRR